MKIPAKNTIRVIVASLTDFTEKAIPLVQAKKRTSVLNTTNQYTFWKDQLRTEIGILLTEHLLLSAGVNEEILHTITRSNFGKPFLPDSTFDFNVTHSGDYVVAVCSPLKEIGIDIEQNRAIESSAYESIFHPEELAFLKSENSPNRFFELWTKKESLLKAMGTGFQVDLASINIFEISTPQFYFHQVDIPGYTCFVCSTFLCDKVEISYYDNESELLKL